MASPFAVFRRNQKIMLATVGIGAMVAFVFLQPLMDYVGRQQAPQNPVVVETKYGDFKESDLDALTQSRELVELFLRNTAAATVEAQIAKGNIDPRSRDQIAENLYRQYHGRLLQRSKAGAEGAAIETLILAKRAEELGMVISDRAINDLLAELTLDSLTSETLQGIINSLNVGRRISTARLFEALRTEMLASNLTFLFDASLRDLPPAQKFEYFLRLNRRAKTEIVPLAVVDFTSQVKNAGNDVLRPFYEKYKDRLPDASSPEPGFKEPRRAAFQYFKADYAKFTEEMKSEVTDEEIRDYYENNKAQFTVLDLPEESSEKPEDETPQDESESADEEKQEPADEATKPEGDEPANKTPADDNKPAHGDEEGTAEQPANDAASEKEADKGDDKPQPEESSGIPRGKLRLVSTAAPPEDSPADEGKSDPPKDAPDGDAATDAPAESSDKAVEKTEEKPAGEASQKPASEATDEAAQQPDKPSESAGADGATAEEKPKEPKYEPLEKVQDQIRDSIAGRKAAERIGEIFDDLQAQMRNYAEQLDIYNTRPKSDTSTKPPAPFPFAELAKKHGVEARELPLVTAVEVASEDIGSVYQVVQDPRTQFGFRTDAFPAFAFSPSLRTYRPKVLSDNEGNSYLFWKTEEVDSFVPSFEKAHDKVLAAWKMIEARPLARKRAEELAGQARAAHKPLKEVFEGDAGLKVIETDSFSWMTTGAVPTNPMGGPVRLSQIEGVEYVGPDFMEAVFALSEGGIGVAENHPQDTVYVVRLAEYEQSIDALRDQFAKERRPMYMAVAQPERTDMYLAWIADLEKQADVHWLPGTNVARRRGRGGEDTSQL